MKPVLMMILKQCITLYKRELKDKELSTRRRRLASGVAKCDYGAISAMEHYESCYVHKPQEQLTKYQEQLANRLGALTSIKDGHSYAWERYDDTDILQNITKEEAQDFFQVLAKEIKE